MNATETKMATVILTLSNSPYGPAVAKLDNGRYMVGQVSKGDTVSPETTYGTEHEAMEALQAAGAWAAAADRGSLSQWSSTGAEGALDDGPS